VSYPRFSFAFAASSRLPFPFLFVTSFSDLGLWQLYEHSPSSFFLIPGQSALILDTILHYTPDSIHSLLLVITFSTNRRVFGGYSG